MGRMKKIIEFKENLYSSPMTTPRDAVRGQENSLPNGGNIPFIRNSRTSYPVLLGDVIMEQLHILVTRELETQGMECFSVSQI